MGISDDDLDELVNFCSPDHPERASTDDDPVRSFFAGEPRPLILALIGELAQDGARRGELEEDRNSVARAADSYSSQRDVLIARLEAAEEVLRDKGCWAAYLKRLRPLKHDAGVTAFHYKDCGIAGGWPHPASAHDEVDR